MSDRKWRATKQHPSRATSGHQISCCLVSLHFLCGILSSHSALHNGSTFWLDLGLGRGPGPDALEGAAHLPDAVGVPGAEEGVLDERGHVARQVAQVRRQGDDVRAAGEAAAEGGRAARQVARRRTARAHIN